MIREYHALPDRRTQTESAIFELVVIDGLFQIMRNMLYF